jgi:hypothetical protein
VEAAVRADAGLASSAFNNIGILLVKSYIGAPTKGNTLSHKNTNCTSLNIPYNFLIYNFARFLPTTAIPIVLLIHTNIRRALYCRLQATVPSAASTCERDDLI